MIKNKVIVRIDKGEEIVDSLKKICNKLGITLGTITGIGATDKITIGLYDTKTKKYVSTNLLGDYEIAPLYGNISLKIDKVYLHLHVNICNREHNSFGGHLNSAIVSATFEAVIDIINGNIDRITEKESGLNLLNI